MGGWEEGKTKRWVGGRMGAKNWGAGGDPAIGWMSICASVFSPSVPLV